MKKKELSLKTLIVYILRWKRIFFWRNWYCAVGWFRRL